MKFCAAIYVVSFEVRLMHKRNVDVHGEISQRGNDKYVLYHVNLL